MVFCLACCTECNNLTLLSLLSFTIFLAPFLTSLPPLSLLFVLLCNAHMVAHHTIFLFRFPSTFHHSSLCPCLSSFPFSSPSSLSVMAYQDGFYGAADLYVSIPRSPLLRHSSPTFSPSCLWVVKCETAKTKPIEMCTFGCLNSFTSTTYNIF